MGNLTRLTNAATSLSRNPLGIIALFIVLIYAFAALVVGAGNLEPNERYPIVLFLVFFPTIVLAVFGWLVSCHHKKLYAPADFESDEAFLEGLAERNTSRPNLRSLEADIERQISNVLAKIELNEISKRENANQEWRKEIADQITDEIRKSSFVTVDARSFTDDQNMLFEYPVSAFASLNDLTNEVFFEIAEFVGPFEYGHSWLLKNSETEEIIKGARIITGTAPGVPLTDNRPLAEVGVVGGTVLEVAKPHTRSPKSN